MYTICSFKAVYESGLDAEVRADLNNKVKFPCLFVRPWQTHYEKFKANKALILAVELCQ